MHTPPQIAARGPASPPPRPDPNQSEATRQGRSQKRKHSQGEERERGERGREGRPSSTRNCNRVKLDRCRRRHRAKRPQPPAAPAPTLQAALEGLSTSSYELPIEMMSAYGDGMGEDTCIMRVRAGCSALLGSLDLAELVWVVSAQVSSWSGSVSISGWRVTQQAQPRSGPCTLHYSRNRERVLMSVAAARSRGQRVPRYARARGHEVALVVSPDPSLLRRSTSRSRRLRPRGAALAWLCVCRGDLTIYRVGCIIIATLSKPMGPSTA